jgi:hypothetical protein
MTIPTITATIATKATQPITIPAIAPADKPPLSVVKPIFGSYQLFVMEFLVKIIYSTQINLTHVIVPAGFEPPGTNKKTKWKPKQNN